MEDLLIEEEEVLTEEWIEDVDQKSEKEENVCPICGRTDCKLIQLLIIIPKTLNTNNYEN
jgi:hypothetical protein